MNKHCSPIEHCNSNYHTSTAQYWKLHYESSPRSHYEIPFWSTNCPGLTLANPSFLNWPRILVYPGHTCYYPYNIPLRKTGTLMGNTSVRSSFVLRKAQRMSRPFHWSCCMVHPTRDEEALRRYDSQFRPLGQSRPRRFSQQTSHDPSRFSVNCLLEPNFQIIIELFMVKLYIFEHSKPPIRNVFRNL